MNGAEAWRLRFFARKRYGLRMTDFSRVDDMELSSAIPICLSRRGQATFDFGDGFAAAFANGWVARILTNMS